MHRIICLFFLSILGVLTSFLLQWINGYINLSCFYFLLLFLLHPFSSSCIRFMHILSCPLYFFLHFQNSIRVTFLLSYFLFLSFCVGYSFFSLFSKFVFFVLHRKTPFLLLFRCNGPYFLLFPSFFLFSASRLFLSLHWITFYFEYFSLALPLLPYSGSRMNAYTHSRPHIQCIYSSAKLSCHTLPVISLFQLLCIGA